MSSALKIKHYPCPHCNTPIETRVPTKALVTDKGYWDSAVKCPSCGGLNFKKVWPGGKIESVAM